jgi:hypothetical protein
MKSLEKSWRDISFFLTPRYLMGLALIIASFVSAFIISSSADRTVTVWASTGDLAPGEIITPEDVTPMSNISAHHSMLSDRRFLEV